MIVKNTLSRSINKILGLINLRLVKKSSWMDLNHELAKFYAEQRDTAKRYGLDEEEFLKMLYELLLERVPDQEGMQYYLTQIKDGKSNREIVESIVESDEFIENFLREVSYRYGDDTIPKFTNIIKNAQVPYLLHKARLEMIKTLLPRAEKILDLGGADSSDPRGALMAHGYSYIPGEVSIIDLPPDERFEPVKDPTEGNDVIIAGQTVIKYYYQSMADLSNFPDNSFDLVWCGESIEHITKQETEKMLSDIQRILKDGGHFCFDTPNRAITELQVGKKHFIHPEHKYEYRYDEMKDILKKLGMKIAKTQGIVNMKKSLKKEEFLVDEFIDGIDDGINNHPESSYLFYFCIQK
ncbi:MAG: DUF4214 domain-containing protein [Acidobacteria bacterium]|nr:DUF4214 domain-containing protein [Acidobacteriota bacterium]